MKDMTQLNEEFSSTLKKVALDGSTENISGSITILDADDIPHEISYQTTLRFGATYDRYPDDVEFDRPETIPEEEWDAIIDRGELDLDEIETLILADAHEQYWSTRRPPAEPKKPETPQTMTDIINDVEPDQEVLDAIHPEGSSSRAIKEANRSRALKASLVVHSRSIKANPPGCGCSGASYTGDFSVKDGDRIYEGAYIAYIQENNGVRVGIELDPPADMDADLWNPISDDISQGIANRILSQYKAANTDKEVKTADHITEEVEVTTKNPQEEVLDKILTHPEEDIIYALFRLGGELLFGFYPQKESLRTDLQELDRLSLNNILVVLQSPKGMDTFANDITNRIAYAPDGWKPMDEIPKTIIVDPADDAPISWLLSATKSSKIDDKGTVTLDWIDASQSTSHGVGVLDILDSMVGNQQASLSYANAEGKIITADTMDIPGEIENDNMGATDERPTPRHQGTPQEGQPSFPPLEAPVTGEVSGYEIYFHSGGSEGPFKGINEARDAAVILMKENPEESRVEIRPIQEGLPSRKEYADGNSGSSYISQEELRLQQAAAFEANWAKIATTRTSSNTPEWDRILHANPILSDPKFSQGVKRWEALRDAAAQVGLDSGSQEEIDFIAFGMTNGAEGRSIDQIIADRNT
jgi:hypothetical protein